MIRFNELKIEDNYIIIDVQIEEDEYFFRKYVIAYKEDMIEKLPNENITNFIKGTSKNRVKLQIIL